MCRGDAAFLQNAGMGWIGPQGFTLGWDAGAPLGLWAICVGVIAPRGLGISARGASPGTGRTKKIRSEGTAYGGDAGAVGSIRKPHVLGPLESSILSNCPKALRASFTLRFLVFKAAALTAIAADPGP